MQYKDFEIELAGSLFAAGDQRIGRYRVRVLRSPIGEMKPDEAVPVEYDDIALQHVLDRLERRELDREELIGLGRTLAAIALPATAAGDGVSAREYFSRSLVKLAADEAVRLRLRLPAELSVIPWEYMFIERAGGTGMDGFLGLDPRVAIVRHEALAIEADLEPLTGDVKVVTALAAPNDLPALNLDHEVQMLKQALGGQRFVIESVRHATMNTLQPLLPGAGIFHFAGHGCFNEQMGLRPGTYTGRGLLAFDDQRIDAEQLGITLRANGVRLAVLAGCSTGRRHGYSVWSGIAPALVKANIPAVVANQYTIGEKTAIAFNHRFYQAIAGGVTIEGAVTAGRIAAYNADRIGRDWGVPVLYLRAGNGRLFRGATDKAERARARTNAETDVNLRLTEIQAGGRVLGADVKDMIDGRLAVSVNVAGSVFGDVHGASIDRVSGGSVKSTVDVQTVEAGGKVVGVKIGSLGDDGVGIGGGEIDYLTGGSSRSTRGTGRGIRMKGRGAGSSSTVKVKNNRGQTIGKQVNYTFVQGTPPAPGSSPGPPANLIEERIRLDVAFPETAVVEEPFPVVIAVRQPDAPPLSEPDLKKGVSAAGSIFREERDAVVSYRVEVAGEGFRVEPKHYKLKLRPGENSIPVAFQLTASKTGVRTLIVTAYQQDESVAAQTRLSIEVKVAVGGVS